MKKFSRIICMLLTAALAISLCACGSTSAAPSAEKTETSKPEAAKTEAVKADPKKEIVGTWKGDLDITEDILSELDPLLAGFDSQMEAAIGMSIEQKVADYCKFEGPYLASLTADFLQDETFAINFDYSDLMMKFCNDFYDGVQPYVIDVFSSAKGCTQEELFAQFNAATAEEFLNAINMGRDSFIEVMYEESLNAVSGEYVSYDGKYEVDGSKISLYKDGALSDIFNLNDDCTALTSSDGSLTLKK